MEKKELARLEIWKQLALHAAGFDAPERHLRHLTQDPQRLAHFSASGGGLFLDLSRQRLDHKAMELLVKLARQRDVMPKMRQMATGATVNTTENRSALHMAARDFSGSAIAVSGADVMPEIRRVRDEIRRFAADVHDGRVVGSTGKRFADVVVIGIGGSYLGTEFVAEALKADAVEGVRLHFLSNVDIHCFGRIADAIDPERTLWVVISKSFTTAETMANAAQASAYMQEKGLDPSRHTVAVTAKGSPGDDGRQPALAVFHMFDFIGGRYSVTSAVGGVPLSLLFGYERFERFLKGAEEMDRHVLTAAEDQNLPLLAALTSLWNHNFLGYTAGAIIPYAAPLHKLAPHIQQLNMESNGKSATADGRLLDVETGPFLFGEPGTNAQHSFFQLAHQGRAFPIEFIGVLQPQPAYRGYAHRSRGVSNHQELYANLVAQAQALALGRDGDEAARRFTGNRPSTTILLNELSPENIGRLLAFYEAKTVMEGFLWGINPFDQFGVELGKQLAAGIREKMAAMNADPAATFDDLDPISRHYLERLFAAAK